MGVNPLIDLLKLPADDRAALAMALWESLTDAERDGVFDLTDEQRRELDRRWQEHQRNPASAVRWSEVRRKLLG
jgi:putative addiction module component (TIGR02574 family)